MEVIFVNNDPRWKKTRYGIFLLLVDNCKLERLYFYFFRGNFASYSNETRIYSAWYTTIYVYHYGAVLTLIDAVASVFLYIYKQDRHVHNWNQFKEERCYK